MRRLLLLVVVILVIVAFYRGWVHVSTDSTGQQSSVTITADQEKLQADKEQAQQQLRDIERKVRDQATTAPADKGQEDRPRP